MVINWEEYALHKVIPSDMKDVHHIISKKLINTFNVNDPKNKILLQRRKHIHLNWLFLDHQNPRDQLKDMLDIRNTALSEKVRQTLYDILALDNEEFYDSRLIKSKKSRKKQDQF